MHAGVRGSLRARPSAPAALLLAACIILVSAIAGGIGAGAAAITQRYITSELARVTVGDQVSFLFPKGYELDPDVDVDDSTGFTWISAGGYVSLDVEDMIVVGDRDHDEQLWNALLRSYPATILGVGDEPDPQYLPAEPTPDQFRTAARRDIANELAKPPTDRAYDREPSVSETTSADGSPMIVAVYTWPISSADRGWVGEAARGWQEAVSYTLAGDTVYQASAAGVRTDDDNELLRRIAMSVEVVDR